jgi:hypothetical protein
MKTALHRSNALPSPRSARAIATALLVLTGAAAVLRLMDAVPGWLVGLPRGVHACASFEQAQAETGLRIAFLRSLPDWHPVTLRATTRPVPAIAATLRPVRPGLGVAGELVFYRSRGGAIPDRLRTPLATFHTVEVDLPRGHKAILAAELLPGGGTLQELAWSEANQSTVMRFGGRTVDLLGLARLIVDEDSRAP